MVTMQPSAKRNDQSTSTKLHAIMSESFEISLIIRAMMYPTAVRS